ncbi:Acetoacetate decarboxylase (ADC) [Gordonia paraffinivorans]|uniref:Acetoacetate decarboxylase (ADC) n=1 Tax=Gordonia paraffinivorans TaxID=175628 RepID=A0ABD7UXM1_9ACTN|nr:acetoacetate decarboxylase family protein [Gordonia paraffinivorans]VFA81214.1 Acetoacetate decarboxylase (ADC) [Gordonia paraffinivorans]
MSRSSVLRRRAIAGLTAAASIALTASAVSSQALAVPSPDRPSATSSTHSTPQWAKIPHSIPESQLSSTYTEVLEKQKVIPSPWDLEIAKGFVAWVMPPTPEDNKLLQPGLQNNLPLAKLGVALRYQSTPVGGYNELGGMIAYNRGATVAANTPFLTTDSDWTNRNGRENWAFPKIKGNFTGIPESGHTFTASGPNWSVSVTTRPAPKGAQLAIPGFLPRLLTLEQVDANGRTITSTFFGRRHIDVSKLMPVIVDVKTTGSSQLTSLMPTGTFPGFIADPAGMSLETTSGAPR